MCKSFLLDKSNNYVTAPDIASRTKKIRKAKLSLPALSGILLITSLLFAYAFYRIKRIATLDIDNTSECLFVGGGGHGAVLFRFGQIEAFLAHSTSNVTEFYCSSAGCIAASFVVAGLPRSMIGDVYEKVYERVDSKYAFPTPGSVVDFACDELSSRMNEEQLEKIKNQLNVLTTTFGVGLNSRKPQSTANLKELLRQSTWIPFLTSNGLYHVDEEGIKHVDGDFIAKMFPPQCEHSFRTPFLTHFDLAWHIFIPVRSIRMMFNLVEAGAQYQSRQMVKSRRVKSCKAPLCIRGVPHISRVMSKLDLTTKSIL